VSNSTDRSDVRPSARRPLRVLLGVTGGIAASKAPQIVRALRAAGCDVRCALTRGAASFVTPLTLEVLSGQAVYQQEYLAPSGTGEELHITAAAWADVVCVAPATAHLLGRLALGLADDFLTTTVMASSAPLVLAPAMHQVMWEQPAVQANVSLLTARGARLVGPVHGPLASGEIGMGRMAEPTEIAAAVAAAVAPRDLFGRHVVVSAGPTYEPIDPVRFLGNRSSGKMGFALAGEAARRGARVTLVAGPVALATPPGVIRVDVESALAMQAAIHAAVSDADLVVMAAAVADFRPAAVAAQKIKKTDAGEVPDIVLMRNPDILAGLRAQAPAAVIVGFAAETERLDANARAKLERKGIDLLVANDVSRTDIGFASDWNEVTLYARDGAVTQLPRQSKAALASALFDRFVAAVSARPSGVAAVGAGA
jgi:phosphopantothenoylcysteine decarboxylase/phosphopantothenate--cysteine ligase